MFKVGYHITKPLTLHGGKEWVEVGDDDVTIEEGCMFVDELFGECVGDVGDVIGGRGGRPPTFLELGLV
tara:strand:+ start:1227 stop:1433 length:207 start_codon:yes stop_codon:yes gene_type:complete